jgi:hypothetical protein
MANATLLSLFQTTLQGMGVATYGLPATVISNTNQDVVQTLALVNAGGDELSRDHNWQALWKQNIFTSAFYSYTGTTTSGSTTLSVLSSTTGLTTNPTYFMVAGTGIPTDTYLVSVNAGASTAVMSQAATASGSLVTLNFSQGLFALPSDFDRQIDRTHWDKSKRWEMLGPETPQQAEWLRSSYISTGPRIRYFYQGGYFQIWPALGAEETLVYDYYSKYWIYAAAGTATTKQLYTVDTDTSIFPDALMRAMIKLKYLEAKGMDTTAALRLFNSQVDLAKSNDSGSPTLAMAPTPVGVLITSNQVPDSGYNQ